MSKTSPDLRSIFSHAMEFLSPVDRARYLSEACDGQPTLRGEIDSLLWEFESASTSLATPSPPIMSRDDAIDCEGPGSVIGHYRLLEVIGEGGMGVVYRADQIHPIRRQVALKIIRPQFDSHQVIARFEAERQALALMDHPTSPRYSTRGPRATADLTSSWN